MILRSSPSTKAARSRSATREAAHHPRPQAHGLSAKRLIGGTSSARKSARRARSASTRSCRREPRRPHQDPRGRVLAASNLRFCAEGDEGDRGARARPPVSGAVITVPAYFNDNRARRPGRGPHRGPSKVLRILNEPTAAAALVRYNGAAPEGRDHDLGGGTFDVSVLEIGQDVFESWQPPVTPTRRRRLRRPRDRPARRPRAVRARRERTQQSLRVRQAAHGGGSGEDRACRRESSTISIPD